ncbi:MAG: response regulator [Spirochaetes bacterium]|nr:response regulator [Spirochaetota bacterium]
MKQKKIFIVEDAQIVALDLKNILEGLGYIVAGIAATGEDAIAMCEAVEPELILMDVKLPGEMNGIEASKEIRKKISVPVIYTTAYSDRNIIDEVQKSFPFGFVIKPYREKDLLVAIETAFTRFEYEKKLEESERKYKSLFEGSNDIIFTLDETCTVQTVNWAVINHLNMPPEEMVSKTFFDLLFTSPDGNFKEIEFVREKFENFQKTRRPINFKTAFISRFNFEPIDMNVRLEYINVSGGDLIIGRAFRVVEDELLKFFISEKQSFSMGTQLFLVGDVTDRMTRNLVRYLDPDTVELIRLALVEIIINAIEHGNLEISYEDKSGAIEKGNYFDYMSGRQANPQYRDRKVRVDFEINQDEARYVVTDSGAGFDYRNFFEREMTEINEEYTPHGRGMIMAKKIFDEMAYNEKGNQVTLVKKINGSQQS